LTNQISDDALLILIPYLEERSKYQLLNSFNRENPEVIKELLLNDAMFYKNTSQRIIRDIEFNYSVIDFRTAYEKQTKKDFDAASFDLIKTMQFKMLFKK